MKLFGWFGRKSAAPAAPALAPPPTLRDVTQAELDRISLSYDSTSALSVECSTSGWEAMDIGVAIDGPYRGELVSIEHGVVTTRQVIPPAKNNGSATG